MNKHQELDNAQTLAELKPVVRYEIDFEKVNSLEDVKRILQALQITFTLGEKTEIIKDLIKPLP